MRAHAAKNPHGGPLDNLARNLDQLRRSPVMWSWVVVVLVIHLIVTLNGGVDAMGGMFRNLGLSREGFLAGKIWQVFSYGFLHGSWWHVGLNGLFVLLIGSRVEHIGGRSRAMAAMAAGVIGGGAGHLLLGSGLLVGLSGACFALLLMLTTLSPQSRMLPLGISGRSLGAGLLAAALLLALINPALGLPGFANAGRALEDAGLGGWFQMGHGCHFGGGIAGWLLARWILRPRVTLTRLRRDRARREAG